MDKKEANAIVQRIWGPRSEAFRRSDPSRDQRFCVSVLCGRKPVLVGAGVDYDDAICVARNSDLGKALEAEHTKSLEMLKQAFESKSAEEFADVIANQAIQEAVASGASEEAVTELKNRFAKAKEKIVNDDRNQAAKH